MKTVFSSAMHVDESVKIPTGCILLSTNFKVKHCSYIKTAFDKVLTISPQSCQNVFLFENRNWSKQWNNKSVHLCWSPSLLARYWILRMYRSKSLSKSKFYKKTDLNCKTFDVKTGQQKLNLVQNLITCTELNLSSLCKFIKILKVNIIINLNSHNAIIVSTGSQLDISQG